MNPLGRHKVIFLLGLSSAERNLALRYRFPMQFFEDRLAPRFGTFAVER